MTFGKNNLGPASTPGRVISTQVGMPGESAIVRESATGTMVDDPDHRRNLNATLLAVTQANRKRRARRIRKGVTIGVASAVTLTGAGVVTDKIVRAVQGSHGTLDAYGKANKNLGIGSPADPNQAPDTSVSHRLDANGNPILPSPTSTEITSYPKDLIDDLPTKTITIKPGMGLDAAIYKADPNAAPSLVAELEPFVTPHIASSDLKPGDKLHVPVVPGAGKAPQPPAQQ